MRAAREASAQALDMVGLAEHARQQARHLTLVDRKRLELARALAAQPHLLLLDEWLAGLNPSEVEAALDLVRRIRESGITIILVEHIVKALFGVSDRILVLATGEKIAEGTPAQVAHDARVIAAYLGGAHADISEAALA